MTEWKNIPENIEDYFGFVYTITHKESGKFYIGRSSFWTIVKYPPLKGRKNKRHKKKESNWRNYWGSSEVLKADVEKYGKDAFEREIVGPCETRWECAYLEAKGQFELDVLRRSDSYNGIINCRIPKAPKKLRMW